MPDPLDPPEPRQADDCSPDGPYRRRLTKRPEGHWVPLGYAPVVGWQRPAAPGESDAGAGEESQGESDPRDSM